MKKSITVLIVIGILLSFAFLLFAPFDKTVYDDGGTVTYSAVTYKIVFWKSIRCEVDENGNYENTVFDKTCVYWFPENFKSLSELLESELENAE